MLVIMIEGQVVKQDEYVFLINPDFWNEEVANNLAVMQGVVLTEEHWQVIRFIRDYYDKFQIAPLIKKYKDKIGISHQRIHQLFPKASAAGACQIAGLPKPTGVV